ncbi:hypothetical protein RB598_009677 [Gaeumannomyces tritici]
MPPQSLLLPTFPPTSFGLVSHSYSPHGHPVMISLYRHIKKKQARENGGKPLAPPPCVHQRAGTGALQIDLPNSSSGPLASQDEPKIEAEAQTEPPISSGKCESCRDEARAATKYRIKIICGLMLPFALQALDVTIVASALPWIAKDFNEVSQLNWIISAFNLTSAAFIPFWGQMADVFGRHSTLQTCVLIMMAGSALCTGAPTDAFPVLLLGRGLQGLGCAGMGAIVRIIIADKVSLKENAKNWTIFAFTAGLSYSIGPVIGGYLTSTNWRWCFGINLPICAASVVLVFLVLRKELIGPRPVRQRADNGATLVAAPVPTGRLARFWTRLSTVDLGGQLLFLAGFGLVVLALTWGGVSYAWASAPVLASLCVGLVLVAAFALWERSMAPGGTLAAKFTRQSAMIHWELLASKDVGLLAYINFATGAAMYSVLYFCNIYFTMVKSYDASKAGVQLIYYTPGLGAGVLLASLLCNRWPCNTFAPLMLGSVVEAVGVGVLAWALYDENIATIYGMMALTGAGTGLRFLPVQLHAVGFFPRHIATIISLMGVMLPFGGTLGLTVMTAVFNNNLLGRGDDGTNAHNFDELSRLPEEVRAAAMGKIKMAIVWAFVAIVPFMVLCMLAASLLGNVKITRDAQNQEPSDEEGERGKGVVEGIYLLHLLRRNRSAVTSPDGAGEEMQPKTLDPEAQARRVE